MGNIIGSKNPIETDQLTQKEADKICPIFGYVQFTLVSRNFFDNLQSNPPLFNNQKPTIVPVNLSRSLTQSLPSGNQPSNLSNSLQASVA